MTWSVHFRKLQRFQNLKLSNVVNNTETRNKSINASNQSETRNSRKFWAEEHRLDEWKDVFLRQIANWILNLMTTFSSPSAGKNSSSGGCCCCCSIQNEKFQSPGDNIFKSIIRLKANNIRRWLSMMIKLFFWMLNVNIKITS